MTVINGYYEATDQNHHILKSKQSRGMNYPCPNEVCILTFPSLETLQKHLDNGPHVTEEEINTQSTLDRVKKSWVGGLGGMVGLRKSGLIFRVLNI